MYEERLGSLRCEEHAGRTALHGFPVALDLNLPMVVWCAELVSHLVFGEQVHDLLAIVHGGIVKLARDDVNLVSAFVYEDDVLDEVGSNVSCGRDGAL